MSVKTSPGRRSKPRVALKKDSRSLPSVFRVDRTAGIVANAILTAGRTPPRENPWDARKRARRLVEETKQADDMKKDKPVLTVSSPVDSSTKTDGSSAASLYSDSKTKDSKSLDILQKVESTKSEVASIVSGTVSPKKKSAIGSGDSVRRPPLPLSTSMEATKTDDIKESDALQTHSGSWPQTTAHSIKQNDSDKCGVRTVSKTKSHPLPVAITADMPKADPITPATKKSRATTEATVHLSDESLLAEASDKVDSTAAQNRIVEGKGLLKFAAKMPMPRQMGSIGLLQEDPTVFAIEQSDSKSSSKAASSSLSVAVEIVASDDDDDEHDKEPQLPDDVAVKVLDDAVVEQLDVGGGEPKSEDVRDESGVSVLLHERGTGQQLDDHWRYGGGRRRPHVGVGGRGVRRGPRSHQRGGGVPVHYDRGGERFGARHRAADWSRDLEMAADRSHAIAADYYPAGVGRGVVAAVGGADIHRHLPGMGVYSPSPLGTGAIASGLLGPQSPARHQFQLQQQQQYSQPFLSAATGMVVASRSATPGSLTDVSSTTPHLALSPSAHSWPYAPTAAAALASVSTPAGVLSFPGFGTPNISLSPSFSARAPVYTPTTLVGGGGIPIGGMPPMAGMPSMPGMGTPGFFATVSAPPTIGSTTAALGGLGLATGTLGFSSQAPGSALPMPMAMTTPSVASSTAARGLVSGFGIGAGAGLGPGFVPGLGFGSGMQLGTVPMSRSLSGGSAGIGGLTMSPIPQRDSPLLAAGTSMMAEMTMMKPEGATTTSPVLKKAMSATGGGVKLDESLKAVSLPKPLYSMRVKSAPVFADRASVEDSDDVKDVGGMTSFNAMVADESTGVKQWDGRQSKLSALTTPYTPTFVSGVQTETALDKTPMYYCLKVSAIATGYRHNDRAVAHVALANFEEDLKVNVYVRPRLPIISLLEPLTSLTISHLEEYGLSIEEAIELVRSELQQAIANGAEVNLIGQNIKCDVEWLQLVEGKDYHSLLDLRECWTTFSVAHKSWTHYSLAHMSQHVAGIPLGRHNAATDAVVSVRLLKAYMSAKERGAVDSMRRHLAAAPRIHSFGKLNPTYKGVCMGRKKFCTCGAPLTSTTFLPTLGTLTES